MNKRIERIIASAERGTLSRDQALAELKKLQDNFWRDLDIAEEAFEDEPGNAYVMQVDGRPVGARVVGRDIGGERAPALIVRYGRGSEFILPVAVDKTSGGTSRVTFKPLVQASRYAPVKKERAAASRESARIQTDAAQAAGATNPFWVEREDAGTARKRRDAELARRGPSSVTRSPGGLTISTPTDKDSEKTRALRAKATAEKTAGKRLNHFGEEF